MKTYVYATPLYTNICSFIHNCQNSWLVFSMKARVYLFYHPALASPAATGFHQSEIALVTSPSSSSHSSLSRLHLWGEALSHFCSAWFCVYVRPCGDRVENGLWMWSSIHLYFLGFLYHHVVSHLAFSLNSFHLLDGRSLPPRLCHRWSSVYVCFSWWGHLASGFVDTFALGSQISVGLNGCYRFK